MLDSKGFDLWADGYDKSVQESDIDDTYPFAGYREVMNRVYQAVREGTGRKILDVGFGTGQLTHRLYQDGYTIFGLDFSERMIAIARRKMPRAKLLQHDFTQGLPETIREERFDCIISTYAIHHLIPRERQRFIRQALALLNPGGQLVIGDVAFETGADLAACRKAYLPEWDDDEYYMVKEETLAEFPQAVFEKISFCAGVFLFSAPN